MFFPIGDTQVIGGHKPLFAYGFIGLNIITWIFQLMDPSGNLLISEYASVPAQISQGNEYSTLFTSMFMHGGWMHLIGNMVFLWIFGDNIEATIGSFKFVIFYFMGGLAASYAHIIIEPLSTIPTVGASGAISAVMGAYLVMFPKSQIKILVFYILRSFHISAYLALGIWIGYQLLNGIGGLSFLSGGEGFDGGGVAYWAHIGGFVFGVAAGFLFKPMANRDEDDFLGGPKTRGRSREKYFPT